MCPENERGILCQEQSFDIGAKLNRIWERLAEHEARLAVLEKDPRCDIAQDESSQSLRKKISELESRLKEADEQIAIQTARIGEVEAELDKARNNLSLLAAHDASLQKENAKQCTQLLAGWMALERAETDNARLKERELPDQNELLVCQAILENTPEKLVELARSRGYNFDNLPAFLASCGKIENLRQLWEACANHAREGAPLPGAELLLEKLLSVFNAAFPDNQASLITANCGDKYRYEEQDRDTSNGDRIAEILLPGMRTPGGRLVKCVVRLN